MDLGMSIIGASLVLVSLLVFAGTVCTVMSFVRFRAQKRHFARVHAALAPGSRVILTSGIYGTLTKVGHEICEMEIAPDVCIKISRFAIKSLS